MNTMCYLCGQPQHIIGWKKAGMRVMEHITEVNDTTTWATGSNSFYELLVQSDIDVDYFKLYQFEISDVFKQHDNTISKSAWSWKDQWPSNYFNNYLIHPTNVEIIINDGPIEGTPRLKFDYTKYPPGGGAQGDIDYFFFYGLKGEKYKIRTSNLTGVDTVMYLHKYTNGQLAYIEDNDDCSSEEIESKCDTCPNCGAWCSCFQVTLTENGWYGIKIYEYSMNDIGAYDLNIKMNDDIGDSAYEAGGLPLSNNWIYKKIDTNTDEDWFKIYVKNPGTLRVETCSSTNLDTHIYLYGDNDIDTPVAEDDDSGTCSQWASKIEYNVSAYDKFYFVRVIEHGQNNNGPYKIRASITSENDTDNGTGNKSDALYISDIPPRGRFITTDLENSNDVDWFKFYANNREHITIETFNLSPTCDTKMELYDDNLMGYQYILNSDKRWIAYDDDDAWPGYNSHIHFVAPHAGYYYIKVYPYNPNFSLGYYTIGIVRLGFYENSWPDYL